MDSGKRFEARFSKSLHLLPGASMRIEDGGAKAKNRQIGDFAYWADNGHSYIIECKATAEASFPFRNIQPHQMDNLHRFDSLGRHRHAVLAINFYGDDYRAENECCLIAFDDFCRLYARAGEAGRVSIPKEWIEQAGKVQERIAGGWRLDFGGLFDGE